MWRRPTGPHSRLLLPLLLALLALPPPPAASAAAAASASAAADEDGSAAAETGGPAGAEAGTCEDELDLDARVNRRIHGASALAALADGGLAQIPGAGHVLIPTLQAAMVYSIGQLYGCHLDRSACLTIVTYLASNHMKKAFLKEVLGFVPGVGNLIKSSVTFLMTEGIGSIAAKSLRCGRPDDLMAQAAGSGAEEHAAGVAEGAAEGGAAMQPRHLFHLFSEYLVNLDLAVLGKEEAWARVKQLFSARGQEELLREVHAAGSAQELAEVAQRHAWNLKIVEAALQALVERFPEPAACAAVDFAAELLWARKGADSEARLVAAPYLQRCLAHAAPEAVKRAAAAAAALLVETRGGGRGGAPRPLVRRSLEVLQGALARWEALSGAAAAAADVDLLTEGGLAGLATVVLAAFTRGEATACPALRALLRLEVALDGAGAAAQSAARGPSAGWSTFRRLQQLDALDTPEGAELCAPGLRADVAERLTLPELPASAEVAPGAGSGTAAEHGMGMGRAAGRAAGAALEAQLAGALVGQRCALSRLLDRPGYVRSKLRGHWRGDMPLVLLLTGPSGTGKTLLARTLAETLLGHPLAQLEALGRFRTFHMNAFSLLEDKNSFFGPPKGIKGAGDLPELLKEWPDAVVLLDEIEKAHPSFARALLKVFGENGAVYDAQTGRDVPTTRAIFILTSNVAKDFIMAHPTSARLLAAPSEQSGGDAEEDTDECAAYSQLRSDVLAALAQSHVNGRENFFRDSEVRGRLTDVLPFLPFRPAEVEAAVRKFLSEEAHAFAKAPEFGHVTLAWEPGVVPFFAAPYAQRPEEGLRGIHNQIHAAVRQEVGSALEAGLLQPLGGVVLRLEPRSAGDAAGRLGLRVVEPGGLPQGGTEAAGQQVAGGGGGSDAEEPEHSAGAGWWWPPFAGSLPATPASTAPPSPSPPAAEGWASELQWERLRSWDWQVVWRQLREYLWERRFEVLLAVMVFVAVATTATLVPVVSSSAAAAAAAGGGVAAPSAAAAAAGAASPGLVAALGATVSGLSSTLTVLPYVVGLGGTAMAGAYAWRNRHEIAWGLMTFLLLLPTIWTLTRRRDAGVLGRCSPDTRVRKKAGDNTRRPATQRAPKKRGHGASLHGAGHPMQSLKTEPPRKEMLEEVSKDVVQTDQLPLGDAPAEEEAEEQKKEQEFVEGKCVDKCSIEKDQEEEEEQEREDEEEGKQEKAVEDVEEAEDESKSMG